MGRRLPGDFGSAKQASKPDAKKQESTGKGGLALNSARRLGAIQDTVATGQADAVSGAWVGGRKIGRNNLTSQNLHDVLSEYA